ncbi:phenylalanine--tRNA ligase subunit beta [Thermocrinis sp.]
MRVPLSWLSEFLELEGIEPEDIAKNLTLKGVEASVSRWDGKAEGVFGKVIKVWEEEGKKVCEVALGEGNTIRIISKDKRIKEGDGVLVDTSRATLLSPSELGLEDSPEGVLIVDEEYALGTPAHKVIGFGEVLLEVEITPNRGDLLSVLGLAREISVLLDIPLRQREEWKLEDQGWLDIRIEDSDCKRYRGVLISGVKVNESPLWLKRRLWQCGLRSINNVVDITNYVMLERGQPLHAFDWKRIEGEVVVRSARKGESISTLSGVHRELTEKNLIIADSSKPLAIAGVVGGADSAVDKETTDILLEAAYFDPYRTRRSSRSLGIQTESSYRFERNVDLESLKSHQNRAVELILNLAGGRVDAVRDVYPEPYKPKRIFLSLGKYRRYAGEELDQEYAQKVLQRLGFECFSSSCGIEALVPAFRSFDVKEDVDLIEEVLRVKGYDSLRSEPLHIPSRPKSAKRLEDKVRAFLSSRGFFEVINFSYESLDLYQTLGLEHPTLEILNPLLKEERFLRTSLIPSLIRSYLHNQRNFVQQVSIFELGRVFLESGEEGRLGLLTSHQSLEEFRSVVSDLLSYLNISHTSQRSNYSFLHPHLQVDLLVGDEKVGFLGVLTPTLGIKGRVLVSELYIDRVKPIKPQYKGFSNYPPVVRDLSLVIDKHQSVDKLIMHIKTLEEVEDLSVFSVWTNAEVLGEGKKSVSFRLFLRSAKGSMSDEEANGIVLELVESLKKEFNVSLR